MSAEINENNERRDRLRNQKRTSHTCNIRTDRNPYQPNFNIQSNQVPSTNNSGHSKTRHHSESRPAHTSYRKPSPMATAPASPIALTYKFRVWRAMLCLRIHANTHHMKRSITQTMRHANTQILQNPIGTEISKSPKCSQMKVPWTKHSG